MTDTFRIQLLNDRLEQTKQAAFTYEEQGDAHAAAASYQRMYRILDDLIAVKDEPARERRLQQWCHRRLQDLSGPRPQVEQSSSPPDNTQPSQPPEDPVDAQDPEMDAAGTGTAPEDTTTDGSEATTVDRKTVNGYQLETPEIDFDDVAGMTDEKQELIDKVLDPFENPEKHDEYGLEGANGTLLYGPPGTGKTYLSRALGGQADANYIEVTASDVLNKYVGESGKNVDRLFDAAEQYQPCVIFMDEAESLAVQRGTTQSDAKENLVSTFLNRLNDLKGEDVVVVGATNFRDRFDDAFLRGGRFGTQIEVGLPDAETRHAVFEYELVDRPGGDDVDLEQLVEVTEKYSIRDLVDIVDAAARQALKEDVPIQHRHLEHGFKQVEPTAAP